MAKILLVSVNDVNAEGLRMLSASLRQNGHQPYIVFLQRNGFPFNYEKKYFDVSQRVEEGDWTGVNAKGEAYRFCRGPDPNEAEEKLFLSLIEDIKPGAIGFTVTQPFERNIAYLSRLIKGKYNIPILWGGPGPTTGPETCSKWCDFVCTGEGEKTIVDIAARIDNKEEIKEVNNLAYLQDGKFTQNPLYPLIANLDELPAKDIDPKNKFLIEDDRLVSNFNEVSYTRNVRYHTISSRGCPYSCSYCAENFMKKLYAPQRYLRRRSTANVIEELEEAKKIVNYQIVQFEDEVFSLDYEWLREFGELYKKRIDVPFVCYIYPNKNIEKQLKLLKEIGLFSTCLALQSGSERINKEIFKRPFNKKLYLETAQIIKRLDIEYYVDIITYNPFETRKDLQATLNVLRQLPKPFVMYVNKLYPIQGTKIRDLIEDSKKGKRNKLVADRTFRHYTRLFFLTTNRTRFVVYFAQKAIIFEYLPFLLTTFLNQVDRAKKVRDALKSAATYIFLPKRFEERLSRLEQTVAELWPLSSKKR